MESKIKLTDELEIDFDFIPVDIVVEFLEIYEKNIDEKAMSNLVLASIKLTRVMDKSDLLKQIVAWAAPENPEETLKKVKTKYRINVYLNLFARIEEYLSLTNVEA